jgi:hypothetical protein
VLLDFGLGHEVKPLPDVRRPDARSAQIGRPEGVSRSFHVSVNKVEPSEARFASNLLAKDNWRSADLDEMVVGWPEMPLIIKPASFACRAERLARAGAGPDGAVVSPSSVTECVTPDPDAGEEVALGVSGKLTWPNVAYVSLIYLSWSDVPRLDKFP